MAVLIEELTVPSAPGAAGWEEFCAMVAVRNACERAAYGTDELCSPPEELLPLYRDTTYDPRRTFVARDNGAIVGRAIVDTQADAGSPVAWLEVHVLPSARGRGIGAALADHAERVARDDARTRLIVYTVSPEGPGPRLTARTGAGSVPERNPEVRFLLRRGYRLEQVERGSRLALPADAAALDALRRGAAAASAGYRIDSWTGATPQHRLADMARLLTRMSTDAPTAGLEEPEDPWTVDRVRAEDASRASTPLVPVTCAAEHVASGRLVAFTTLFVPPQPERAVTQDDTLVLAEHRGHRLGAAVKLAALDLLQHAHPGHPAITTFNAEENRPMLRVNEAMGFVPFGHEGAWRKDLPPA